MNERVIAILIGFTFFFVMEKIYPFYRNGSAARDAGNIFFAIPNGAASGIIFTYISLAALSTLQMPFTVWDTVSFTGWPAYLLVFLLLDLWTYTWHRMNHRIGFLWRFHRAHHSDLTLSVSTHFRFHTGEIILSSFIRIPVLLLLGMPIELLFAYDLCLNLCSLFQHSNIRLPETLDRALRIAFVTPQMHRVHHSTVFSESNSNYSTVFSLWDRALRTYRKRDYADTIKTGLDILRSQKFQSVAGILMTPLYTRGLK